MAKLILGGLVFWLATTASAELAVQINPSEVYLVMGKGQSCTDIAYGREASVRAPRMVFHNMKLTWDEPHRFQVLGVHFEALSKYFFDGKYTCSIAGKELALLFDRFDTDEVILPAASNGEPVVTQTGTLCRMQCGGMSPTPWNESFQVPVKVTLYGYVMKADGTAERRQIVRMIQAIYL